MENSSVIPTMVSCPSFDGREKRELIGGRGNVVCESELRVRISSAAEYVA
jgi:hypothetical protein